MQTALLMASKEGKTDQLVEFAYQLQVMEWRLLGSKGTAKFLRDYDVQATDIATMVGDPILNHRVVSLSREVHAGLISGPNDQGELDRLGITRIDLLFVDFYHTDKVIAEHPDIVADYEAINEQIDIGGPAAVRSAIKGGRIVLASPRTFNRVIRWLKRGKSYERQVLAGLWAEAEQRVADYVGSVARFRADYDKALQSRPS
jgi:AICAR transformylase/IMP cyclohydrolase PurH